MRAFRNRLAVLWDDLRDCCDPLYGIGGGALLAWVLLASLSNVFSGSGWPMSFVWRPTMLVLVFVVLLAVSLSGRAPKMSGRAVSLLVVYGLAMGFGVLLFASSRTGSQVTGAFLGLAMMSLGLVALVITWGGLCANMPKRERVGVTAMASMVGSVLYLFVAVLPDSIALIVGALLPIAAAAVLQHALLTSQADEYARDERLAEGASPQGWRLVYDRAFAVTIMVFGGLFALAVRVLDPSEWAGQPPAGVLMVSVFLVVEIMLTTYMIKVAHREDPNIAFRPTALLAAAGFLLLPLVPGSVAPLCMAVSFSGIGAFLVYYWIVMGNISQRYRWSPALVYSQGLILLTVGVALGEGLHTLLDVAAPTEFARVAYTSVVALFVLSAMLWLKVEGSVFASEPVDQAEIGNVDEPNAATQQQEAEGVDTAIASIAAKYGISPREAEIIRLLARGRNVPYICDELFIAKSTVQTHIKHIYAKLGLSSRQELIDLIERAGGEKPAEKLQ